MDVLPNTHPAYTLCILIEARLPTSPPQLSAICANPPAAVGAPPRPPGSALPAISPTACTAPARGLCPADCASSISLLDGRIPESGRLTRMPGRLYSGASLCTWTAKMPRFPKRDVLICVRRNQHAIGTPPTLIPCCGCLSGAG